MPKKESGEELVPRALHCVAGGEEQLNVAVTIVVIYILGIMVLRRGALQKVAASVEETPME